MIDKAILSTMLLTTACMLKQVSGYLCEIDSKFGDGDHGVTIKKIALLIEKSIENWNEQTLSEFIDKLGCDTIGISGGSAGPLWGTLISGLAIPLSDHNTIDGNHLKKMFLSSLSEMEDITTARVGDKTMMDTLIPAVEAANACEGNISDILLAAMNGAKKGAIDSENYISKFGRAKSYKEKTIGTPDAGAVSLSVFFEGLYQGYIKATN